MQKIKQAVILAGGKGERLLPLTLDTPKPMIPIGNEPFLNHIIRLLKKNGIEEIVILCGYLYHKICDYYGDGQQMGVTIRYSIGEVEDETGTRIRNAAHLLDDTFLLLYSDNYFPFDLRAQQQFFQRTGAKACVTIFSNWDASTRSNMKVNQEGIVTLYDKSRQTQGLDGVDIGFFILQKSILALMPAENFSFEKVVLPQLISKGELAGYITDLKYYSIGNHERLPFTERYLSNRKIVFLDRDGVINKKAARADYIKTPAEFEFLPGVLDAIQKLSENQYEIYIITNQAGIARGKMSVEDLEAIHRFMTDTIRDHGGRIHGIYYCPHGWDEDCDCRKPKPGMLRNAARDHAFDLTQAVFIGDDERDALAGLRAQCKTILLAEDFSLTDAVDFLLKQKDTTFIFDPEKLAEEILERRKSIKAEQFFIAIGGCARSGKSTLAGQLATFFERAGVPTTLIGLDNWLLGIDERANAKSVRDRYRRSNIVEDILALHAGRAIQVARYNPLSRKIEGRDAPDQIKPVDGICIIEGVIALDIPKLREIADFTIFVEISDRERLARLHYFYNETKGCSHDESTAVIDARELEEIPVVKSTRIFAERIFDSQF
jgi:D-glycero-D-manno-heptose 1,7-bisphosphate phosphatase